MASLTDAAHFRDAQTMRGMSRSARDAVLRAAMMYNDGRVILEKLNHPACEGIVLDLYEEALQIAVDQGRIAPTFVSFMHNVARTCLNEQNLPERRTLGWDPDRANRGGSTLGMDLFGGGVPVRSHPPS